MREIKFRAWDGVGMIYCGQDQSWEHGWNLRWLFDHCDGNIMEFTGLLDKSGVEIYEGDILDSKYKLVVSFERDRYKAIGADPATPYSKDLFPLLQLRERAKCPCAVIGNIYENKELLE